MFTIPKMINRRTKNRQYNRVVRLFLILLILGVSDLAYGQIGAPPVDSLKADSLRKVKDRLKPTAVPVSQQYDFRDMVHDIFTPHKQPDSTKKRSGITVIPNVASNPTIGSQIGIKAVAGKVLGHEPGTLLSVAATSASITTKGILYFYINHNVFTPGNRWNFQGSLVAAKSVSPDNGLGIGNGNYSSPADIILSDPTRKAYGIHSLYFNLREKVYKKIAKDLFLGAGLSFDIRRNITTNVGDTVLTPYKVYNERYGFSNSGYSSNGFLFNIEYTTRDNQNRAYKGVYLDAGFRINQTWIGSTKNAVQFNYDFRKYFSLSSTNPQHVIAFWNWGAAVVTGQLPYLELPGTGRDGAFRSGRGYLNSFFRGTQFDYTEVEYRFPILRNNFLSGVAFGNLQTANDRLGTKIFETWQPGGGAGLRILFDKTTRTNLCLDYAWGKYNSKGFFLGLNEAF